MRASSVSGLMTGASRAEKGLPWADPRLISDVTVSLLCNLRQGPKL